MSNRFVNALCWLGIFLAGTLVVVMLSLPYALSEAWGQELFFQQKAPPIPVCLEAEDTYHLALDDTQGKMDWYVFFNSGGCEMVPFESVKFLRVVSHYIDSEGKDGYVSEFLVVGQPKLHVYSILSNLPPHI